MDKSDLLIIHHNGQSTCQGAQARLGWNLPKSPMLIKTLEQQTQPSQLPSEMFSSLFHSLHRSSAKGWIEWLTLEHCWALLRNLKLHSLSSWVIEFPAMMRVGSLRWFLQKETRLLFLSHRWAWAFVIAKFCRVRGIWVGFDSGTGLKSTSWEIQSDLEEIQAVRD